MWQEFKLASTVTKASFFLNFPKAADTLLCCPAKLEMTLAREQLVAELNKNAIQRRERGLRGLDSVKASVKLSRNKSFRKGSTHSRKASSGGNRNMFDLESATGSDASSRGHERKLSESTRLTTPQRRTSTHPQNGTPGSAGGHNRSGSDMLSPLPPKTPPAVSPHHAPNSQLPALARTGSKLKIAPAPGTPHERASFTGVAPPGLGSDKSKRKSTTTGAPHPSPGALAAAAGMAMPGAIASPAKPPPPPIPPVPPGST